MGQGIGVHALRRSWPANVARPNSTEHRAKQRRLTMNMDQRSTAARSKVIEGDAKVAVDLTFGPAKTGAEARGNTVDSLQQTQHQAYSIWEVEGGSHGKDVEHWLRAQRWFVSGRPH